MKGERLLAAQHSTWSKSVAGWFSLMINLTRLSFLHVQSLTGQWYLLADTPSPTWSLSWWFPVSCQASLAVAVCKELPMKQAYTENTHEKLEVSRRQCPWQVATTMKVQALPQWWSIKARMWTSRLIGSACQALVREVEVKGCPSSIVIGLLHVARPANGQVATGGCSSVPGSPSPSIFGV